jgi:hypothetical protein
MRPYVPPCVNEILPDYTAILADARTADVTNIEWFCLCVVSGDRPERTPNELVRSVTDTVSLAAAAV